jgi:hypothetical protein
MNTFLERKKKYYREESFISRQQRVLNYVFIESQAFSQSYDPPPPATNSPSPVDRRRHTGSLRKRDNLLLGEGEVGGRGAESSNRKKA